MTSSLTMLFEQYASLWVRSAVAFGVINGVALVVLPLRAPALFPRWEILEGILLLGLSYGLWRRSLACAVILLLDKLVVASVYVVQYHSLPNVTGFVSIFVFMGAVATINLERSKRTARESAGVSPQCNTESHEKQSG